MELPTRDTSSRRTERRSALLLCAGTLAAGAVAQLMAGRPAYGSVFAPGWLPVAAAVIAAAGIAPVNGPGEWLRAQRTLQWSGLLLMIWAANGLPLDLLRAAGLIPLPVDWPGLVTKALALGAVIVLAHLALARPAALTSARPAAWYGYAAFVFALPYPVLRAIWALGGTPGLDRPGAAGQGYAPLVLAAPWVLAAALSLLLVPTWRRLPRRLLLAAGWTATAIVGMIGPAACWALLVGLLGGGPPAPPGAEPSGIALWVFALFYGSWLFFSIAEGAATRSYQLRSARPAGGPAGVTAAAEVSPGVRLRARES